MLMWTRNFDNGEECYFQIKVDVNCRVCRQPGESYADIVRYDSFGKSNVIVWLEVCIHGHLYLHAIARGTLTKEIYHGEIMRLLASAVGDWFLFGAGCCRSPYCMNFREEEGIEVAEVAIHVAGPKAHWSCLIRELQESTQSTIPCTEGGVKNLKMQWWLGIALNVKQCQSTIYVTLILYLMWKKESIVAPLIFL